MGDTTIQRVLAENDVSLPAENVTMYSSIVISGGLLFLIGLLWWKRKQRTIIVG
jgi:hypothetical protein